MSLIARAALRWPFNARMVPSESIPNVNRPRCASAQAIAHGASSGAMHVYLSGSTYDDRCAATLKRKPSLYADRRISRITLLP
jgi:hypothetical protein